jgi:hypothetical protein
MKFYWCFAGSTSRNRFAVKQRIKRFHQENVEFFGVQTSRFERGLQKGAFDGSVRVLQWFDQWQDFKRFDGLVPMMTTCAGTGPARIE